MTLKTGLTELRLTKFKTHSGQTLRFQPLSLLVGRNGSGKSNALDALTLLALLADGRALSDLERGDSDLAGLRGGITGAAPLGKSRVEVGCTAVFEGGDTLDLDVVIDVGTRATDPIHGREPEIVKETLKLSRPSRKTLVLIQSSRRTKGSDISDASVYNGGNPRTYQFLSSRLATTQAVTKVPEDIKSRQLVVFQCRRLVGLLSNLLILDPAPDQMREYSRIGAATDRRGRNVSSLVYSLRQDPRSWDRLNELMTGLVDSNIEGLDFAEARLPDEQLVDVMVALRERFMGESHLVPARLMSDGSLRYLAIVASLLFMQREDPGAPSRHRCLVVEEVENGLFPSQASEVLDLLRAEASNSETRLIATTHSPALLDSLRPEDHFGVSVFSRDDEGQSVITPLVEHPNYIRIAGDGRIGRAATTGQLTFADLPPAEPISEIIG